MRDIKILLLGAGELGKELVITFQRMGIYVIACDSYHDAPAMQVAHASEVFSMLDAQALLAVVEKHKPTHIVPEIEAINTDFLEDFEKRGMVVVPSAKAAQYTLNRKLIRDLAANELGLKTAPFLYADNLIDFRNAINEIGLPCVVKPLMSSSGKGQSVVKNRIEIDKAFELAMEGARGNIKEVIIEAFVDFESEITLLTITQHQGETLFCPPIGHRQDRGDYQESWQPAVIRTEHLLEAQRMARKVTAALGGAGIWGVEFFIAEDGVYFSELSPRPHDTGMVTLAGTQNLNEFELHARAILGYPIHEVKNIRAGVSAAILAHDYSTERPIFTGLEKALSVENSDFRVFRKPTTRPNRRMAVYLLSDEDVTTPIDNLVERAKTLRDYIKVEI